MRFSWWISNWLEDMISRSSPKRGVLFKTCTKREQLHFVQQIWLNTWFDSYRNSFTHSLICSFSQSLNHLQPAYFFLSAILLNCVKCLKSMTIFVLTEGKPFVSSPPPPFPLCSHYVISLVDDWLPSWLIGWLTALQSNCDCVTDWLADAQNEWLTNCTISWLLFWLTAKVTDWFAGWLSPQLLSLMIHTSPAELKDEAGDFVHLHKTNSV